MDTHGGAGYLIARENVRETVLERDTDSTLRRIRAGAFVLAMILITAVMGYRWAGWSWIDAIYMVAITVSTVGYGEIGPMTPELRVFTVFVLISGMTASAFTFGSLIQLLAAGEINRALGIRMMSQEIGRLRDHVVICGFGRIGKMLSAELSRKSIGFLVIDQNHERAAEAQQHGHHVLVGDATDEDILISAGVERAKSLVTALPSDADNVFITLTSRNLNRSLKIIARGEYPTTQKKLMQAGADRVVLPAAIGAQRIAAMLTRPTTVELMELFAGGRTLDVEVDELQVPQASPLVGKSVEYAEAARKHGLLVVAVKRNSGEMVFNPGATFHFAALDTVIAMGRTEDIARFRQEHSL